MAQHGGNLRELARAAGRSEKEILDFSGCPNPLGPPEWLRPEIASHLSALAHYPDPECAGLRATAAACYGVQPDEILAANSAAELLYLLARALCADGETPGAMPLAARAKIAGKRTGSQQQRLPVAQMRAVIPVPSYSDYACAARQAGWPVLGLSLREEDGFKLDFSSLETQLRDGDAVFLGRPNNPTGLDACADELRALAERRPGVKFIVDETFGQLAEDFDSLASRRPENFIITLSLADVYGLPGLPISLAIAPRQIARRVRELRPPSPINVLAQAVGAAALKDAEYLKRSRAYVRELREQLLAGLREFSELKIYPGCSNFLLARLAKGPLDAGALAERLLMNAGIAIRACGDFDGLDGRFFRIAVRTEADNKRLIEALKRAPDGAASSVSASFPGKGSGVRPARRAQTIMFQGTSSNAGKSVLCAALCRILLQDGHRVAPFKAQNMSLNSFVTRAGGEMGRAQAMQAQACRIEPDVRMNPVLLKSNSDTGSQVILLGKPLGNMNVSEYMRYMPAAFEKAKQAFDTLAAEYDVIVLEGAGSPAEVNLKRHDIVNMPMARHARAPVLLVGDIDRGGVFASFIGTMEVLSEWERELVAGFVINLFRGEESLLGEAIEYTRHYTGRPCFGVVPYLKDLGLPEEDSVAFKGGVFDDERPGGEALEIAVIDLPYISNFTDFDALRIEPDTRVRIVRSAAELNSPDAVILPGSKTVLSDLEYLKRSGLAEKIKALAGKTEVVGLCGGFQILGEQIDDPQHTESERDSGTGLRLLPMRTVLARDKTLVCSAATHVPTGLPVHGYEIHHGQSDTSRLRPEILRADGEVIGAASPEGRVWGTYLHGVFDSDTFRRWFLDRLRTRRGLPPLGKIAARYDLEPAFDRLAEVVRKSLRVDEIYARMGLRQV